MMEAADIYHAIKRERPDLIGDMTQAEFVRAVKELKAVGAFQENLPPKWMIEDFPPWRLEELMHVIRETVEDYRREQRKNEDVHP